jgi:hypothetical protein
VTLVNNDRLGYWDAWVRLVVDPASPCVFTRGISQLELPSRHGEGKLVYPDAAARAVLEDRHQVPLRYADADGRATELWPDNPDGSPGGAAALCDPSGRIFGLMPHPEAYLYPENHPRWIAQREAGVLPTAGSRAADLSPTACARRWTAVTSCSAWMRPVAWPVSRPWASRPNRSRRSNAVSASGVTASIPSTTR